MLKEIVSPRSSVIRFASTFWAVSDRVPSTPHSRIRLPNIRNPTRATDWGAASPTRKVVSMGNAIRIPLDTVPGVYSIRMQRSFFVVTKRIAKG